MSEDAKTNAKLRSAQRSTLPIISIIEDKETFDHALKLLKGASSLNVKKSEIESRLEEIKLELAAICEAFDLKGFRHGLKGFEYHGYTTRKTLNNELLVAAGVPAKTIAECYKESAPFLSAKIVAFDIP